MPGNNWFEQCSIVRSCNKVGVVLSTEPLVELSIVSRFTYKFPYNVCAGLLQGS